MPLVEIAQRWDDERADFDRLRRRYLDYSDGLKDRRQTARKTAVQQAASKEAAPSPPEPAKAPVPPEEPPSVEETLSP